MPVIYKSLYSMKGILNTVESNVIWNNTKEMVFTSTNYNLLNKEQQPGQVVAPNLCSLNGKRQRPYVETFPENRFILKFQLSRQKPVVSWWEQSRKGPPGKHWSTET